MFYKKCKSVESKGVIMGIHPVSAVKTTWANASKPKKAAMVAGTVATTAAVAATAVAAVKGKASADATGIKKLPSRMANGYKQVWKGIKSVPSKISEAIENFRNRGDETPAPDSPVEFPAE